MKKLLKSYLLRDKISLILSKHILLLYFFGILTLYRAQTFQNLVPNGSFETYTQCPTGPSQIYLATNWTGPIVNSSDYYNSCSSSLNVPHYGGVGNSYYYLNAKTGVAYIGVYTYQLNNVREYAQAKLVDTLKNGVCYYLEFYATNTQWIKYKTNNVAAVFFPTAHATSSVSPFLISSTQHITNYGNPDILQVQFTVDVENEFKTISIYNKLGQLLREEDLIFKNKTASIKTDDLRNGVYVLKLHGKSLQTVSKRFVINH